jgi:hypothetical protein
MNSVDLYKLKNDIKCVILSENIISNILESFSKSNIKIIKCAKKQVSTIKTNKVQAKKDLNENKIIMIMNKISENNINELIGEYISNIFVDTEEKYNVIMTELFNKMVKDVKFIENYIKFAIKIFIIEKKRLNLFPEEFINNIKITINSIDDNERNACFIIIRMLVKYGFFNKDIIDFMSNNIIKTQDKSRYIDCYNWFNGIDNTIKDNYKDDILSIAIKCNNENMNREKILIESLIDIKIAESIDITESTESTESTETTHIEEIEEVKTVEASDSFNTSLINILEEYQFIKSIEEIIEFINIECQDINNKNSFCMEVINSFSNNIAEGLNLIDILIKKRVLFKSNISKGLVMFLNKNENIINNNIVQILKYLKTNNITKNIEHIFKRYKVKLYYE